MNDVDDGDLLIAPGFGEFFGHLGIPSVIQFFMEFGQTDLDALTALIVCVEINDCYLLAFSAPAFFFRVILRLHPFALLSGP